MKDFHKNMLWSLVFLAIGKALSMLSLTIGIPWEFVLPCAYLIIWGVKTAVSRIIKWHKKKQNERFIKQVKANEAVIREILGC